MFSSNSRSGHTKDCQLTPVASLSGAKLSRVRTVLAWSRRGYLWHGKSVSLQIKLQVD